MKYGPLLLRILYFVDDRRAGNRKRRKDLLAKESIDERALSALELPYDEDLERIGVKIRASFGEAFAFRIHFKGLQQSIGVRIDALKHCAFRGKVKKRIE